jgi:hypothetical protein
MKFDTKSAHLVAQCPMGGQVQVRQVARGVAMRTGRLVMAVPAETAVMSTFRCNRKFSVGVDFHPSAAHHLICIRIRFNANFSRKLDWNLNSFYTNR